MKRTGMVATLTALTLGATAAPAGAQADRVEIAEWTVPWEETRPRDPDAVSAEEVWFVGQRGDYLARLDPASGKFDRFDLEPGTGPHNLIVDEEGAVWYAGNRASHIGRLDPESGAIETFPMPDPRARDPHTLAFDPEGRIWFTVQGGNMVGRLDPATGEVRLIEIPTPRARPYGIAVDETGSPWFTEFGSHKIGTVDPATMELREIALPRQEARPRRLAIASDGTIWYVDYAGGFLGRLDPRTGSVEEWPAPGGSSSKPYGMTMDAEDRPWFVETGPSPNRFVGFDPAGETFAWVTPIPSGGGAVRHMDYYEPGNAVWFGTDTDTVGRARLP